MAETGEWRVEKGVEYAVHDGVSLRGDLYQPAAPGVYPAIIAVHGGGWQSGGPASYRHFGAWFAQRGYVFFPIAYRLSKPGVKTYPEAVHDVRAAVQFLRGRGAAIKVDGDHIGMMGGSAGGQLVALVALAGDEPPFAGAYPGDEFASVSTRVQAVAPFYGVFDMCRQWSHDAHCRPYDNITEKFIGAPATENRRAYIEASPTTYAERRRNDTPFLLITGTEDDVVDRSQTDDFLLMLRQAKFYARRIVLQGAGHFFESEPLDEPFSRSLQASGPLLRFFAEFLKGEKKSE
jgi:acetyl esterase/lipase